MTNTFYKVALIFSFCLITSCSTFEQVAISPTNPIKETLTITPTKYKTAAPTTYSYIGVIYPPLPPSIKMGLGRAIWKPSTPITWGVDAVRDENNLMLWLSEVIRRDEDGRPFLQVRDVLFIPPSAGDKDFVVGECVIAGEPDFELLALVNLDEESLNNRWLPNSNIISVWRANLSKGIFEEISTENVECNAETFINFR